MEEYALFMQDKVDLSFILFLISSSLKVTYLFPISELYIEYFLNGSKIKQ